MKPQQEAAPSGGPKSIKDIESQTRARMDKVLTALQHDIGNIRTGRASVNLLDNIRVDYFGTPTP